MTSCLDSYNAFDFTQGPWTRTVFRRGNGPAVILIHEIPGLHPLVVRHADRIADAGMTVYLPSLFGEPGRPFSKLYQIRSSASVIWIRREFFVWATDRSSPIVEWLRALARHAQTECGGKGVGMIARPVVADAPIPGIAGPELEKQRSLLSHLAKIEAASSSARLRRQRRRR